MNCVNNNCPRIHRQSTYDFVKIKENYDIDADKYFFGSENYVVNTKDDTNYAYDYNSQYYQKDF